MLTPVDRTKKGRALDWLGGLASGQILSVSNVGPAFVFDFDALRPTMTLKEDLIYLDHYDADGEIRWCWKRGLESSQEFDSEESALDTMRNGRLEFTRLGDW